MVQVILNADDFGKSHERNCAIDEAFKQGLICSAGLIVTGKYLGEALDYITKGGYVENIHLHLNLSANQLQEDSNDTPLTNAVRKDSFFCKDGMFKLYTGLPHRFIDIIKWRKAYHEIVAQYERFKEVTKGQADYKHIDFHLWYNLTWPVSVALKVFIKKYNIESVRYIGIHQMNKRRYKLFYNISRSPLVEFIPATNIDYYLSKKEKVSAFKTIELYCHPHYKNGVLLDDSPSYLKHERQPLPKQIQLLKENGDYKYLSWKDIKDHTQ